MKNLILLSAIASVLSGSAWATTEKLECAIADNGVTRVLEANLEYEPESDQVVRGHPEVPGSGYTRKYFSTKFQGVNLQGWTLTLAAQKVLMVRTQETTVRSREIYITAERGSENTSVDGVAYGYDDYPAQAELSLNDGAATVSCIILANQ